jgi:hypothetical protein
LANFILERANDMHFISHAGKSLKRDNFGRYVRIFLEAYPDPRVEEYTRRIGVHNVLEMSQFLRILGPQTIQCTLNLDDDAAISFVVETTKNSVEYIRIVRGKQDHSTIDFDVDFKLINKRGQVSKRELMKRFLSHNGGFKGLWSTFRFLVAIVTEFLVWKINKLE